MRRVSSNDLPLHAPVSAVSAGFSSLICFAVGNRVLASDGLSPAWLVTQLPHGAFITALEQHPAATEGEEACEGVAAVGSTVVISSGDCVFVSPLTPGSVARFVAATCDAARVLCVRSVGSGVAVVTSHNAACVIPAKYLSSAAEPFAPQWSSVAGLGAALAADALRMTDGVVGIFAGTYAGAVAVWRAKDAESRATSEVIATIDAHRLGCAVFAVRALRIDASLCVATCSDDRSATLYHSPAGGAHWTCLWRADFSRSRVFDVAVRWDAPRAALLLAVCCENGGVHGFAFSPPLTAAALRATPPALRRAQQHSGRGAWRVALADGALLSCGFDGSVHRAPFPESRGAARRQWTVRPPEMRGRQHVRGVACDERGTLLACTEDFLCVRPRGGGGPWRVPLPGSENRKSSEGAENTEECGRKAGRKSVPTCLEVVGGAGAPVALIGSANGSVCAIPYANEDEAHKCDIFVRAGAASKALLVCGLRLSNSVLAVTVHADGALLLSAHGAEPRRIAHNSAGTRATVLCARAFGAEHIAVIVGDRDGGLALALQSVDADAKELIWHRERVFGEAVAAIYAEGERVTAVSRLGERRILRIDIMEGLSAHKGEAVPLHLPWNVSDVLAFRGSVAVTQFGSDVTVYSRHGSLSSETIGSGLGDWRPIAQYHDVRAPRLLCAIISEDSALPVFFCHCSDGASVEWYACDTDNYTQMLNEAETIGRDYNAVVAVPIPTQPIFVCGNENSMITTLREERSGASETLCGPHVSNVLAITVLPGDAVRLATAGGQATLAVWEWSPFFHWCILAVTNNKDSNRCGNGVSTSCVPRFLSVTAAGSVDTIAVGSSDGILRVFMLKDSELTIKFEISLAAMMSPRPITALGRIEEDPLTSFIVAGDTCGTVVVCDVVKGAVLSHLSPDTHWPAQAVNALAVNRLDSQSTDGFSFHVLAAMDSGDVVLMRANAMEVVPLSRLRVGLTALRGVHFIDAGRAVTVNDEGIVILKITDCEELSINGHRRTNVRGVSGIAVSQSGTLCVVGQGVELVPLLELSNIN